MVKILFVCHGNICRSPMAEFVMKKLAAEAGLGDALLIESAATSREEIGNDLYPPAQRCLRRHGVPFTHRRARQVTAEDYGAYDLIVIMEEYNRRNLRGVLREDPEGKVRTLLSFAGSDRDVADPWYTNDFETAYEDILEGCAAILEQIQKGIL